MALRTGSRNPGKKNGLFMLKVVSMAEYRQEGSNVKAEFDAERKILENLKGAKVE